jgi:BirA family biotin operon repressor/biotin-[acetyl-CoA-carboxylase] ligase
MADVLSDFQRVTDFWVYVTNGQRYHAYHERPVRMMMHDGRLVDGIVKGVADDGILLVETALGLQRFSSGEISLRSI